MIYYKEVALNNFLIKRIEARGGSDIHAYKMRSGDIQYLVITSSEPNPISKEIEKHVTVRIYDKAGLDRHLRDDELDMILKFVNWNHDGYQITKANWAGWHIEPRKVDTPVWQTYPNPIPSLKTLIDKIESMQTTPEDTVTVHEIKLLLNKQLDSELEVLLSHLKKGNIYVQDAHNHINNVISPILNQINDIQLLANAVVVQRKLNEASK